MTRQDVEQVFGRREEAIAHRDAVELGLLYAEDAIVDSPTAGGAVRGRAAIETVNRAWFSGFPDVVFTTETVIIDGDRAVWIGRTHGTDTGGFMGLDATNKPFELPMVMVCTLADGLIVHERRIYDFTGMLVQIGVLKAKLA
jgi:predicted ester cyclase